MMPPRVRVPAPSFVMPTEPARMELMVAEAAAFVTETVPAVKVMVPLSSR